MSGAEGQDWANYQVAAPATAGLGFVFVKATEGGSYVNPKHDVQVAHVRAGGLVVGHYHFQRPGSPTGQAAFFLKHARPQAGDVLACDWEDTGVSCADKDQFIRAVRAAQPRLRTVLYCNRDFWLHRDTTSFVGDGLWIADPSAPKGAPRVDAPWLFHQYGSPGGLDRNYSPLTAAALHAWAAGTTPITPQQEDDVSWTQILKIKKGPWFTKDQQATAEAWLMGANGKAEAAAEAAATANTKLDALTVKVDNLTVGGVDESALAAKVAALLPKPATAAEIADLLAARMKS